MHFEAPNFPSVALIMHVILLEFYHSNFAPMASKQAAAGSNEPAIAVQMCPIPSICSAVIGVACVPAHYSMCVSSQ